MKIIELDSVNSTNEYIKNLDGTDIIVCAKSQTGGKGTKGRSFSSSEGGLYISLLRRPENFKADKAFKIMINASVAVCETLKNFGVNPVIKWANDVLINGKKICGTLIENTISNNFITNYIVGIGININNVLPAEIEDIATSLKTETGKTFSVEDVKGKLIENLQKEYSVNKYKSYINWFDKKVKLLIDGKEIFAVAKDVDETGRLTCEIDGEIKKISSAEVSLRI